jgi:hypothetical protein
MFLGSQEWEPTGQIFIEDMPASLGQSLALTAEETLRESPLMAISAASRLSRAYEDEASPLLSKQEADDFLTKAGYQLDIGDEGIRQSALDILIERQEFQAQRDSIRSRAPTGFWAGSANLGVGLAASLLDPINVATAFVPVVSVGRYSAMLAAAKTGTQRAATRAGVGAAEGVAGAALVEPIVYSSMQYQQADYGALDSMLNVGFGALFGGALHSTGGAFIDWRQAKTKQRQQMIADLRTASEKTDLDYDAAVLELQSKKANENSEADVLRERVVNAKPETIEATLQTLVYQASNGKRIDATAVLNADEKAYGGSILQREQELRAFIDENTDAAVKLFDQVVADEYISKSGIKGLKSEIKDIRDQITDLYGKASWDDVRAEARNNLERGASKKKVRAEAERLQKAGEQELLDRIESVEKKIGKGKDAQQILSMLDRAKNSIGRNRDLAIDELIDVTRHTEALKGQLPQNREAAVTFMQDQADPENIRMGNQQAAEKAAEQFKARPVNQDLQQAEIEAEAVEQLYNDRFENSDIDLTPYEDVIVEADKLEADADNLEKGIAEYANCMGRS